MRIDELEDRLYPIGEAAKVLNVHVATLRRWEKSGFLVPMRVGPKRIRHYTPEMLRNALSQ